MHSVVLSGVIDWIFAAMVAGVHQTKLWDIRTFIYREFADPFCPRFPVITTNFNAKTYFFYAQI
jgi:hypothetical protein